jgi:hypothetical protein
MQSYKPEELSAFASQHVEALRQTVADLTARDLDSRKLMIQVRPETVCSLASFDGPTGAAHVPLVRHSARLLSARVSRMITPGKSTITLTLPWHANRCQI